jgi:hypothetical protein
MLQARQFIRHAASALTLMLTTVGALSEEPASAPAPALKLELNGAQPSEKGCRLTFVVNNMLGTELSKAAFEIALFSKDGVVDRLTVLDFKELPAGKTKVARFDLSGVDWAKIGGVLVNHATECAGDGIEPTACLRQLKTETKTGITFGT